MELVYKNDDYGADWPDEAAGMELVSCNVDQADDVCVDDNNGGWTWLILELSKAVAAI